MQQPSHQAQVGITAYFYTKSLFGKIYWYMFLPFHRFIFTDLIEQIEKRSRTIRGPAGYSKEA